MPKIALLECPNGCTGALLAGAFYDIAPFDTNSLPLTFVKDTKGTSLHFDDLGHESFSNLLDQISLADDIQSDVEGILALLEGVQYHRTEQESLQAFLEIVCVAQSIKALQAQQIYVSTIRVGQSGERWRPSHATLKLLAGFPVQITPIDEDLCDEVGAAIIKYYACQESCPIITPNQYGVGCDDSGHQLRIQTATVRHNRRIVELVTNIDDQSSEEIGYAIDALFEAGALDVYTTPVHAKKNRPGILFTCMCKADDKEQIRQIMFRHLSTLGIREYDCQRYALIPHNEVVDTPFGPIRRKISEGYGVTREKYEYEDLAKIANQTGLSIQEIRYRLTKKD